MENPMTWGEAERTVHEVLIQRSSGEVRMGLSTERRIVDALRAKGLLIEAEPQTVEQWAAGLGVLAVKKMAEDMPGGTHGKKRPEVMAWLLANRRDVLEESMRLSTGGVSP
jgi:hypothetical protein